MSMAIFDHKKCAFSVIAVLWGVVPMVSAVLGDSADRTPLSSDSNIPAVTVIYDDVNRETIYGISGEMCSLRWVSRDAEPGVVLHREHCALPLFRQIPLLSQVISEFLETSNPASFRTLFWGRLTPDGSLPASQEMSIRLALAAYRSPKWDIRKGKPKKGDINGFIKDLANEKMIYSELEGLFKQYNKRITISSVEKVLVSEARKLPYFDRLKPDGIHASDKLPFDCMVWFGVSAP